LVVLIIQTDDTLKQYQVSIGGIYNIALKGIKEINYYGT